MEWQELRRGTMENLVEIAAKFTFIETEQQVEEIADLVKRLKQAEDEIRASFDPIVDKAYKAHKEAIAQRDEHLKPVQNAQRKLKSLLADWHTKQEQIRLQAALKEAERLRIEKENQILAEATILEENGETQAAEEKISEMVYVAPKYEKPKIEGFSFVEIWDFVIENPNLIPREYLIPDEVKIRQVVKATKGELQIPGIRAFKRKVAR